VLEGPLSERYKLFRQHVIGLAWSFREIHDVEYCVYGVIEDRTVFPVKVRE